MTQDKKRKNLPRMHVGWSCTRQGAKCTSRCRRAFSLAFCTMTHTRSMTAHVYKFTCFVREVGSPSQMHHRVQRASCLPLYHDTHTHTHTHSLTHSHTRTLVALAGSERGTAIHECTCFFFREGCFFGTRAHAEGYIVA
jgi:hypothetical protein